MFSCRLINGGGFLLENQNQSMGTINGTMRFIGQTFQEGPTSPFLGVNTWGGGGADGVYMESIVPADPTNGSFPLIDIFSDHTLCPSCTSDGAVNDLFLQRRRGVKIRACWIGIDNE